MANFVKIYSNDDDYDGIMFNLEAIESVSLKMHRVFTIGSDRPYIIKHDKSWDKIVDYIRRSTAETHF